MGILEETKYEKLFSTPVLRFRLPEHPELNEGALAGRGRDAGRVRGCQQIEPWRMALGR